MNGHGFLSNWVNVSGFDNFSEFSPIFITACISGHISIPKFMAMTVLPQILLDSLKVNTTKLDAQCLKRKKERKLLYYY